MKAIVDDFHKLHKDNHGRRRLGLIMAAGVMVTIPALIFFVAVQRYLVAGWGAGGLKG